MESRRAALAVSALGVGIAALFVMANAAAVGYEGFVAAGTLFAADAPILVTPGGGYDGQFYYRMAIDPFSTDKFVSGVEFDRPAYRQQRIVYPLLAFAVTAVTPLSVVEALVAVNVAAVGIMTFFAARIAHHYGRHAAWGLIPLAWPAFLFSLALDLAEITFAACVLAAVLAFLRGRDHTAVAALAAGVLVRETILILTVVFLVRTRKWRYAVPIGVAAIWQLAVLAMWGTLPALDSQIDPHRGQLDIPLRGIVEGIPHWSLVDVAIVTSLIAAVWAVVQKGVPRGFLRLGIGIYGFLALILARPIWESWRGWSRALTELVLLLFVARVSTERANEGAVGVGTGVTAPPPPASTPA